MEREAAESSPSEVASLVRRFAERMIHSRIRVSGGRVIATYERVKPLVEDGVIPNQALDDAAAELDTARGLEGLRRNAESNLRR